MSQKDDLISRQAAIDALKGFEFCHYIEFGEYIGEDTREVRLIRAEKAQDALQNLPPAQPEHKTGKWMLFENQRQEDIANGNYMYTCSNCLRSDIHAKTVKVPYCWFCGAKMEVEQE